MRYKVVEALYITDDVIKKVSAVERKELESRERIYRGINHSRISKIKPQL
ncbi:MAG: hypothetical protein GF315_01050 [candidate division Zixibacteria bacterium]|nr:hypothetical protein [candidate division Zixibacteria bacterium]